MWNEVPQPITIRRSPCGGSAAAAASSAARRQTSGWLAISCSMALMLCAA